MQKFKEPVGVAYIDVDLQSSTKNLPKVPILMPAGRIFSQDGHLLLIIELLNDEIFWKKEVGIKKPEMRDLGKIKLVEVLKK